MAVRFNPPNCLARIPGALAALLMVCALPLHADKTKVFLTQVERDLIAPIAKRTPGSAVAVVVDGKLAIKKTFGFRRYGHEEPVGAETLFRIASLSKTFASAAAAVLISENARLSWETPVLSRLDLRFQRDDYGQKISLQHLMSQSTGLMPHAYTNLIEDRMSYPRMLKRLHKIEFICEPGKCYGYQNVVFSLIGDVIEVTTGSSYHDFVKQKLFDPLAMTRASIGLEAFVNDADHSKPHIKDGQGWTTIRTTPHYYKVPPAAGVNASIDDMGSWLMAQLGNSPDVLPIEMLDELHSPVVKTTRYQSHYPRRKALGKVHYGLGWRVFDYGPYSDFLHHGGYVKGMRSEMVFNRQLKLGLVFLTNSEPSELNDLIFDFIDLYIANLRAKNA